MTLTRNAGVREDWEGFHDAHQSMEIIEETGNPNHQGFIGFLPPRDQNGKLMDNTELKRTARRIASELILLPKEHRGSAEYPEDYLKEVSQCRLWTRLRCAYCDCFKKDDTE